MPVPSVPEVTVGDIDPMSLARIQMGASPCISESPTGRFCTRVSGHHETTDKRDHPARRHVHLGPDGTVWEVW